MQGLCIILQFALLAGPQAGSTESDSSVARLTELTSRVDEVMITPSGAALTRLVEADLEEGLNRVRVVLWEGRLQKSETELREAFTTLATGADILSHTIRDTIGSRDVERLERLRSELKLASEKARAAEERILGANAEIDLLESVARTIVESRVELDAEALLEFIEPINLRRRAVIEDLARQKRVSDESLLERGRLLDELAIEEQGETRMICEILARSPGGPATFVITRRDPSSNWTSEVEIDWNSEDDSARTRILGRITNRSGLDWNDVELTLDTGPRDRSSLPEPLEESVVEALEDEETNTAEDSESATVTAISDNTNARDRAFMVDTPITLADGATGLVLLEGFETTFTTSLIARPLSSQGVHGVGTTRNNARGIIPPSRFRMIKDGRALTGSTIPMIEEQADFQIPLGIRDDIVISRRLVSRNEIRTGLLNGGKLTTLAYRITIRNMKDTPCRINVEDRIPISRTEDIEVALKSATPEPTVPPGIDGTLQWLLEVPAGGPGSMPVVIDWEVTIAHSADLETGEFIE